MKDVVFIRQQGGLARTAPGEDFISAFIAYGSLKDIKETEGTGDSAKLITPIFSLRQAEDLGILTNGGKYDEVPPLVEVVPAPTAEDPIATEEITIDPVPVGHGVHNLWHYHISEFFRINPTGVLWLGLYAAGAKSNDKLIFTELAEVQRRSNGSIRQAAIFDVTKFDKTVTGTIQGVAETLETEHTPLSVLYAPNFYEVATTAGGADDKSFEFDEEDIKSGNDKNVSVIIGQDGGNLGNALFERNKISTSCVGAALGAISKAAVHESIAWVQEFDVSSQELGTLALADGTKITDLERTQLDTIDRNGYIFLKNHIGIAGSFFNDSHTVTSDESDFAFIENNRTIDKAVRGIRRGLLPQLSAPVYVDEAGEISFDSIKFFESLAARPLEQMRIDGELSNYDVNIDPTQQILSTSKLEITVRLIPVGVARTIEVSIGFALSVA